MPVGPAVVIRGAGGLDALAIEDRQVRDPGPGEVLVAVAAAGLNRADVLQRRGVYPAPPGEPADIPGLEYAGTVAAVGPGVLGWDVGARVMGIAGGGAMASWLVAHHRTLVRVPDSLSLDQAAAIPEAFFTAYDACEQGGVQLGSQVLIHAVGSGVGTAALQLAAACGARAIGTARTPDKLARCAAYGLADGDGVVVAAAGGGSAARFADAVLACTGGRGCDAVLDLVGAAYLEDNVRALAERGRIVAIGLLGGATGALPLWQLLQKRGAIVGTVLRARPVEEKAALARRFEARVAPLLAQGKLRPVIDDVLPMARVADAHARMERGETFGKLVLRW